MIQIKKGDTYIEVDNDFSNEEFDTFEKQEDELDDTLELSLDLLKGESNE